MEEKKNTNPWQELEDVIKRQAGPMDQEYLKDRMASLNTWTMGKLLDRSREQEPAMSRSQSRNRSEGAEIEEEAPAKTAKTDVEEEEGVNEPSVVAPVQGSVQQ